MNRVNYKNEDGCMMTLENDAGRVEISKNREIRFGSAAVWQPAQVNVWSSTLKDADSRARFMRLVSAADYLAQWFDDHYPVATNADFQTPVATLEEWMGIAPMCRRR